MVTAAAALAFACGGGAPTRSELATPFTPAPTVVAGTLTVVSGADGAPVAGAAIHTADGGAWRSDAAGRAAVEIAIGARTQIGASGFFTRNIRVQRLDDLAVVLWPSDDPSIGLTEDYTRKLVYTSWAAEVGAPTWPMGRLAQVITRVSVVPQASVRSIPGALDAVRHAADRMTAATGVAWIVRDAPEGATVTIEIDPTAPCGNPRGCVFLQVRGYETTGAAMKFSGDYSELANPGMYLHELGHVIGLEHSLRTRDLMMVGFYSGLDDFTPAEKVVIHMMGHRRAGNLFPDDDPGVLTPAGATRTRRIDCAGP
jgi:hypothetical protein